MKAAQLLEELKSQGRYLVLAESITGGQLTAEFTKIPGASEVVLAGLIAYDTAMKHELLGVSKQLLENQGPVDPEVAAQMALGARSKIAQLKRLDLEKIVGIASTGVAGPSPQAGAPVGRLYVAISLGPEQASRTNVYSHDLTGSREEIQKTAVLLGVEHLGEEIGR